VLGGATLVVVMLDKFGVGAGREASASHFPPTPISALSAQAPAAPRTSACQRRGLRNG